MNQPTTRHHQRPKFMNNMLDDIFYPTNPICQIIPTDTTKRQDYFCHYRPKPHQTCLDYNISQTDTKMDAGDTKIHYQQTIAEYIPCLADKPPPKKKKKIKKGKYFSGGPPQWVFVDEIWRKYVNELQKSYHKNFKIRVILRKRMSKFQMNTQHRAVVVRVGPDWYQELSPQQLRTIDNLKNCILKDLADGTTINTQENIAELGLVLRPNRNHVKKALDNCCKCPAEFLLVLYQLINPKRTKYSINDRLLLSGVVHLTMRATLKELHIRIPSPPPPPKVAIKKTKKKKVVKYKSPYLVPYTFKRPKPKFSGIYGNKHVQYPQSPYFCYLKELKEMRKAPPVPADEEIEEELKLAQEMYENLVDFRPVPLLLRPSRYTPCDNFRNRAETIERLRGGGQNSCGCCKKKKNEVNDQNSDVYEGGLKVKSEVDVEHASVWTQAGTVMEEPPVEKPAVEKPVVEKPSVEEPKTCKHIQDLETYNKMYHLIRPSGGKEKEKCKCKEKYKKLVEKPLCQCEKCRKDRREKSSHFVIAGLKDSEYQTTVRVIDRVAVQKPCTCLKQHQKVLEEYEKEKEAEARKPCSCRKETTELAQTSACSCEKCVEDRRKKAAKFIIAGTKEDNLRIIEGTSMGKPCECWKRYEKKADKYEEFKSAQKAVVEMKQKDHKYIIGGLAKTPQGPVYVISGMRPPIDCVCAKNARAEAVEKRMQEIMPQMPPGRVPYNIVGVKETEDKNLYILGSALPVDDCDCMAVLKKFEEQHSHCIKLYEEYLAKVKGEYNEFMDEMLPPSRSQRSSRVSGIQEEETSETEQKEEKSPEIEQKSEPDIKQKETPTSEQKSEPSIKPPKLCQSCRKVKSMPCACYCDCAKTECKQCICGGEVVECVDCICGPSEIEEVQEEEEKELMRFFIFSKILCDRKWQRKVLRKALNSMADDDFPLAKLPQSYKLPHFKLWMEMRCGMFWTQQDRYDYIVKSKTLWRHCHKCTIWNVKMPSLKISKAEGHALDWSKAGYCRKLVNDTLEKFYRKLKQNRIHYGREFFPTTFTYEFPFKSWRDCYFAYTPSKEEDVIARFVWQTHEYKHTHQ